MLSLRSLQPVVGGVQVGDVVETYEIWTNARIGTRWKIFSFLDIVKSTDNLWLSSLVSKVNGRQ